MAHAADASDEQGDDGRGPVHPRDLFSGPLSWLDRLDALTGGMASNLGWMPVVAVAATVVVAGAFLLRPGGGAHPTAGLPTAPTSLEGAEPTPAHPGDGAAAGAAAAPQSGPAATETVAGGEGTEGSGASDDEVAVHVAGAVLVPGLHVLPTGSRVADAIAAAGGIAPGADLDRLNLAAPLLDGSRVWIPTVGQEIPDLVEPQVADHGGAGTAGASQTGGDPGAGAVVDLNAADAAALEALPGVGPSTAQAIVAHREANGPFRSVDELIEVRGIGPAKLEQIRPMATV